VTYSKVPRELVAKSSLGRMQVSFIHAYGSLLSLSAGFISRDTVVTKLPLSSGSFQSIWKRQTLKK
jgi:hypothetical protein